MTTNKTIPRVISVIMAIAMALTMTVSAFASDVQPYNADATAVTGSISQVGQNYYFNVKAPTGATKINVTATLYQKNLLTYKEVDSTTATANSYICSKTTSYAVQFGKSYKLEVVAEIYCDGEWDTITKTFTATF